jgi:hypothetical protein
MFEIGRHTVRGGKTVYSAASISDTKFPGMPGNIGDASDLAISVAVQGRTRRQWRAGNNREGQRLSMAAFGASRPFPWASAKVA